MLDELRAKGRLELPRDVNTEDADLLAGPDDDVSMRSGVFCHDLWRQQCVSFLLAIALQRGTLHANTLRAGQSPMTQLHDLHA